MAGQKTTDVEIYWACIIVNKQVQIQKTISISWILYFNSKLISTDIYGFTCQLVALIIREVMSVIVCL